MISIYRYISRYVDHRMKASGLHRHVVQVENFTIDYWDGDETKPALLMIPAFAADTKYSWYKQVRSLSKSFRLIIPNLLYFGQSTMKDPSYSLRNQAEMICCLMSHLNIKKYHVVAASYGALVVAELLPKETYNIEKLVLTNVPLALDERKSHTKTLAAFGIQHKADLLVPSDKFELRRLFKLTYFRPPRFPLLLFKDIYKNLYEGKTQPRRKLIECCFNEIPYLSERFSALQFPVLLLWGEHDLLAPVEIGHKLAAIVGRKCTLQIISKTAHLPNFERSKVYNRQMLNFLLQ